MTIVGRSLLTVSRGELLVLQMREKRMHYLNIAGTAIATASVGRCHCKNNVIMQSTTLAKGGAMV